MGARFYHPFLPSGTIHKAPSHFSFNLPPFLTDLVTNLSRLNSTQASYVLVTVTVFPLTYQYQPGDLWVAYGTAVVATLAAALIGLLSMYASETSYSPRFSTAVRIAKTTSLDRLLDDADDRSNPLPREIGIARRQVISSGGISPSRSLH